MKTKAKNRPGAADEYLELVRGFPLRPIRDVSSYETACTILTDLISRADDPGLSAAESDYADVLGRLVRDYDEKHATVLKEDASPIDLLKHLMEEHSMNTTQLGELLGGGKGLASMILNGKRELSKANIRVLANHFRINPGVFL